MEKWKIVLTPFFKSELKNIRNYITEILCVHSVAESLITKIIDLLKELETMPLRYPLYEDEKWRNLGLRKITIDRYVIFYYANEQKKEVVILHIFYSGRNIDELLNRF